MQIKLTIDGKLVDPESLHPSKKLSADELKHLATKTSDAIERKKQLEEKHLNDAVRKVKMEQST